MNRQTLRNLTVVPMLTPFTDDDSLDEAAIERLVNHILGGGCQALLVNGTTGETASMPLSTRARLTALAVQHAKGRGLIFAGVGDNCLGHSVDMARRSFAAGAHAVVAPIPSYYPLSSGEMEAYYRQLALQVEGPLFLYNIPQATGQSIPREVIEALSHLPNVVGIKDSEPDGDRQEALAAQFKGRTDFVVLCGAVPHTIRAMRAGAEGYVPSAGNFFPQASCAVIDRYAQGDEPGAEEALGRLLQVSRVYQGGRNVSQALCAMKAVLALQGLAGRRVLPPLLPCDDEEVVAIRRALEALPF